MKDEISVNYMINLNVLLREDEVLISTSLNSHFEEIEKEIKDFLTCTEAHMIS